MLKLGILSVFTNVRVRNIDTRIENYFDPQCSWTPKLAIPFFFFHVIFTNVRVENIRS
jgi:tetrahydromethanopterin S-methyltransferase subunit D